MASDTNEKQSDLGHVQAQHVEDEARDVDMRINLGWRSWVRHFHNTELCPLAVCKVIRVDTPDCL